MKKIFILFISLVCFVTLFTSPTTLIDESIDKGSSVLKDIKDTVNTTLNIEDNLSVDEVSSNDISSENVVDDRSINEIVNDSILLSLNDDNYIVDVDTKALDVSFVKIEDGSNVTFDKYINVDYEKVAPILKSINDENQGQYSFLDYLNIYNQVKPHVDTNIPFSEGFSLVSNFKHLAPSLLEEFKLAN